MTRGSKAPVDGEWSLDISDAERLTWRIQRIGWGLMLVVAVAALGGVLGDGPLSRREVRATYSSVQVPRVARLDAPATLSVISSSSADSVRVRLDPQFAPWVERWLPQDPRAVVTPTGTDLVFRRTRQGTITVTAILQPGRVGVHRGQVTVDQETHAFAVLVLP